MHFATGQNVEENVVKFLGMVRVSLIPESLLIFVDLVHEILNAIVCLFFCLFALNQL